MGNDGDKVRGTLERDFAEYAKKSQQARSSLKTVLLLSVARPLLGRAAKFAGDRIFAPDQQTFMKRLAEIRERSEEEGWVADDGKDAADASAQERLATARGEGSEAAVSASTTPNDEATPTGI